MIKNVLEYLENTAQRSCAAAVIDENGMCSYADLLQSSKKIGSALAAKTECNKPVAVLMEKGIHTLSAFFGIVYAGCYYTLLNPDLPSARLMHVQNVLQAEYVITDDAHLQMAREIFPEESILLLDNLKQSEINQSALNFVRDTMIDTDPLYVNFTSGSTGVPKGVVIGHRSVIDFIEIFTEIFHITGEDVIGNQAPFDFDVSVKDIYSAIKTGASLVMIPKRLFSQPVDLLDFICDHNVTTMIWAVSALCLISTFHGLDYKTPHTVNKILFSGEVMPMKHLNAWMTHLPDAEFVNLYGPTEITCNCTYHRIDRSRNYDGGIPIGKAFPNERVFLLDEHDCIVREKGVSGEICVSGTAVGLGYFRASAQTMEKFPQNPVNGCYHERIYRTGDLACYDEQGNLRFLGRKDFQIKYMGHRIELEEIEKAIAEMEGVERACCVFDEEKSKLYGYYVGTSDGKELRRKLSESLPIFMVPSRLMQVERMPLSKNGKIDRKALLAEGNRKR